MTKRYQSVYLVKTHINVTQLTEICDYIPCLPLTPQGEGKRERKRESERPTSFVRTRNLKNVAIMPYLFCGATKKIVRIQDIQTYWRVVIELHLVFMSVLLECTAWCVVRMYNRAKRCSVEIKLLLMSGIKQRFLRRLPTRKLATIRFPTLRSYIE